MATQYINAMSALWNSAGTTYAAIKMNVTNAASAAASMLMQLQTSSVDKFTVDKNGNVTAAGSIHATGMVTTTAPLPSANDSAALGSSAVAWSDLYLAFGGIINWAAGDITITHDTNAMAFGGATSGYTFDFAVKPAVNDGSQLGASGTAWADLFLASGGMIDWANGDIRLVHSSNVITFTGGDLQMGAAGVAAGSVVTAGLTQTLANKTLTTPVINSPSITSPTITGMISGSPTITTPTITSPTITGMISGSPTINAAVINSTSVVSSGAVTASQNFQSSTAAVVLGATGTGIVYLRPNGVANPAGQLTVDTSGNLVTAGDLTANGAAVTVKGSSAMFKVIPTAGNGHIWFYAADGATTRMILYTSGGAQGSGNLTVGTANFGFSSAGNFAAPGRVQGSDLLSAGVVYANSGTVYLSTDGNVVGSLWSNWGAGDAYTAISNQIEARALAWANDRVSRIQARKVSLGYNGTSGGFSNLGVGTVICGYLREGGGSGQVNGLYYVTLQLYDPVSGWVSFTG